MPVSNRRYNQQPEPREYRSGHLARLTEKASQEKQCNAAAEKPSGDDFNRRVRILDDPAKSDQCAKRQSRCGAKPIPACTPTPGEQSERHAPYRRCQHGMAADHAKIERANFDTATRIKNHVDPD